MCWCTKTRGASRNAKAMLKMAIVLKWVSLKASSVVHWLKLGSKHSDNMYKSKNVIFTNTQTGINDPPPAATPANLHPAGHPTPCWPPYTLHPTPCNNSKRPQVAHSEELQPPTTTNNQNSKPRPPSPNIKPAPCSYCLQNPECCTAHNRCGRVRVRVPHLSLMVPGSMAKVGQGNRHLTRYAVCRK